MGETDGGRGPPTFGLTLHELGELTRSCGLPQYAARQLAGWLYGRVASGFAEMSDLPRAIRDRLEAERELGVRAPESVRQSEDGTRKYLFRAGDRFVESAFIPDGERGTLCLSVQVGCRWGCRFCATGRQGFHGNLTPGEILNQYRSLPERERVTNLVFMGMGEPLDNLANVMRSLEILTSSWGYALSPARITVSTVGILPALETFLERSDCHLAVSVHSPFPDERERLMPVEKAHPLADVLALLRRHARESRRGRRVSFEYVVLRDLNDSPRHAREMVRILRGISCRVNLIGLHGSAQVSGAPLPGELLPSPRDRMEEMQGILKRGGIMTTIRVSRGEDIAAACGMLSTRGKSAGEVVEHGGDVRHCP